MNSIIFNTATKAKGHAGLLEAVGQHATTFIHGGEQAIVGTNLLAVESLQHNPAAIQALQHSASTMLGDLEGFVTESFGVPDENSGRLVHNYTKNQMQAATIAALLGHNLKAAIGAPTRPGFSTEGIAVCGVVDTTPYVRRASNEAYDEQSTATSVAFSVGFNLECARQSELAETLFPTVVIPPNEAGLFMSIDIALLQDDAKRQVSGAVTNFNRFNVIRAQTYPELLQNDASDLVPVHRTASEEFFVDPALFAPIVQKMDDGTEIETSFLKQGAQFDLLAISHTDAMVNKGLPDQTDSIDPGVSLDEILISITDGTDVETLKFKVKELPYAAYYAATQGDYKDLALSFDNNSLKIDSNTKLADGSTSTLLAPLVSGNYEARLSVSISGRLNVQFGTGRVYGAAPSVALLSKAGVAVGTASGAGKNIADLFVGAKFEGYKLAAKRSNLNRRLRGQTMDTNTKRQFYPLNLLAPVTIIRPHSAGDVNDARDLSFLVFTTKTRSSIDAVDVLQSHAALMKSMQGRYVQPGETVETFGLARFLLDPYYAQDSYNAPAVVDSIKSHERAADIQASLVNMIRDHVYKMWQLSSYGPASASQNGGVQVMPTVLIATDPRIEQYLNITGDLRLLGDKFPVKVVSDTNIRMRNKLYITFGNMETAAQGVANVLHFGTTQYRPEMTIILPVSRDGQTSKEITVSPAFRHHVNLPLLVEIDIHGIEDVVNRKLPVFMHNV